jgi:hypothetical protein
VLIDSVDLPIVIAQGLLGCRLVGTVYSVDLLIMAPDRSLSLLLLLAHPCIILLGGHAPHGRILKVAFLKVISATMMVKVPACIAQETFTF